MSNYTAYHVHTQDSLLDSATYFKDYIDYAASLGQTAIGFSEHGNIFNWVAKKQYAESKGLKYLHGIEVYLTERLKNPDDKDDKNIRDNYHTVLIAKNRDGMVELHNLYLLSTQKDHFYYKPRLTFEEFFAISGNIIKISACVQSPLNKYRLKQDMDELVLERLLKHYDYYEIQYHNMQSQIEFNRYLYEASKKHGKPLIAATDTHSLNKYKAECRTVLQYGKTDGAWGDEENECDLTYKTYNELVAAFLTQDALPLDVVLEAIENTNRMADSVDAIEIDTRDKYPILYGEDDELMLWRTLRINCKDKLDRGIISKDPRYLENIKEEMRVFKKINMIGFMLFMSEIMSWARENGIATGFARGSVAGSTVAYIANITDVDPIKWNTVFSRFANENRIEAGDIDTDWYEDDRQKVYDHIIERFGTDKTAYILAQTTLADKAVIDVIGKAFRIKAEKAGTTSVYTIDRIKEIKVEYDSNREKTMEQYSDIFYYYNGLVGCTVAQSQHPAGIVVSPLNLVDNFGGFYGADGQVILPIDMDQCHDVGNVKFDILGLKSVGVIDKTCKMLGHKFPRADEINWNDPAVYEDIDNDHTAIFQFESSYSGDCLKRFQPKSVAELSLVNACIRPSGETYRDELLSRHRHKNPSEIIDKMLYENYGHLVYQEDTLAFLQEICGFSGSAADTIRRAIGKKQEAVINEALPKILDGYCSKSDKPREVAEQEAKEFLDVIASSSSYQFGKNHSVAYSMLSYTMGYLRHYHPTEFCTAFLNCAKNDDDILNGTKLATDRGCRIVSPKFRYSTGDYSCDPKTKTIYKGLGSIKSLSIRTADALYLLKDNKYDSFVDLLVDIDGLKKDCDARQLEILIKLNYFSEFGNPNLLLKQREIFEILHNRKTFKITTFTEDYPVPLYAVEKFAEKKTEKTLSSFDWYKLCKYICSGIDVKTKRAEMLKNEYEILGYLASTYPRLDNDYYFVTGFQGKSDQIFVLYQLKTGQSRTIRYRKKWREQNPTNAGDIIKVLKTAKEGRWTKNNYGEWVRDNDNLEENLLEWQVLP